MEMEGEEKSWILVHVTNHTLQKQLQTGTTKLPKEWTPPFLRADFNIALTGLSQKKYMGYQHISNISDRYYEVTTDWKRILTEESSCICKEMFINYLLSTIWCNQGGLLACKLLVWVKNSQIFKSQKHVTFIL